MAEKTFTNSDSRFNNLTVFGGIQKAAEGEYQATVYVLTSKIKAKINSCIFTMNNMKNQDERISLCDMVENWSVNRVFKFFELYGEKYKKFKAAFFKTKVHEVNKMKICERKNKPLAD